MRYSDQVRSTLISNQVSTEISNQVRSTLISNKVST